MVISTAGTLDQHHIIPQRFYGSLEVLSRGITQPRMTELRFEGKLVYGEPGMELHGHTE